ncbi:hypothetical protein Acr_11g0005020 [Actinidia rufa]|uniref:Uncharacterized protein n=1 Tax=Actinidia rufa TaxID=165716 RepID=A0A7J0FCN1_9ERIC|nr:hypothetical protein Acr_11g0005020 [Actinidia rufa]
MADEASSVSARGVEQEGHEPQEQHQSNAMDRLATLMVQYMEFQMARPVRSTTLHEQFMKLNLPEFVGAIDLLVAEEWLKKLDAIFEVMEVTDEQKLTLATFMLRGDARNWVGLSRQRSSDVTTTTEQSRAQTDAGSARPGTSRGGGRSRGRGSWRPSVRPNTARSGTMGGIVCYRCGVDGLHDPLPLDLPPPLELPGVVRKHVTCAITSRLISINYVDSGWGCDSQEHLCRFLGALVVSTDFTKVFGTCDTLIFIFSAQQIYLELYFDEPRVGTKVALKTVFGTSDQVLNQYYSALRPQTDETLICSRDWLFGERKEDARLYIILLEGANSDTGMELIRNKRSHLYAVPFLK